MVSAAHAGVRPFLALVEVQALRAAADADLVRRFAATGDEAAFRVIAERHGPMVLGVCARALGCRHAAEDALQATFLVFARRADAARQVGSLAGWLHGVARKVAARLRRAEQRRRSYERAAPAPRPPADDPAWSEVRAGLDEELGRLPAAYREVLVMCYLEGLTRDEAGRRLGVPAGAVKGRLERGRRLLAARLTRRGLGLSVGLLGAVAAPAAAACVARLSADPGLASPRAAALSHDFLRGLVMSKVKLITAGVVGTLVLAAGLGTGLAQQPGGPPAKSAVKALGDQLGDADEAFIRRVSVDLRGKEPTPAEVHFFLASKDANKRATLVDLFVKERVAGGKEVAFTVPRPAPPTLAELTALARSAEDAIRLSQQKVERSEAAFRAGTGTAAEVAQDRLTLEDLRTKLALAQRRIADLQSADKAKAGDAQLAEARELLAERRKAQELARVAEAQAEERAAWAARMAEKGYLSRAQAEVERAKADAARAAAEKALLDAELAKTKDADAQARQAAIARAHEYLLRQQDAARAQADKALADAAKAGAAQKAVEGKMRDLDAELVRRAKAIEAAERAARAEAEAQRDLAEKARADAVRAADAAKTQADREASRRAVEELNRQFKETYDRSKADAAKAKSPDPAPKGPPVAPPKSVTPAPAGDTTALQIQVRLAEVTLIEKQLAAEEADASAKRLAAAGNAVTLEQRETAARAAQRARLEVDRARLLLEQAKLALDAAQRPAVPAARP